jgi:3-dehydroquinate synthase
MREEALTIAMKLDGKDSCYVLGPLAGLELSRYVPNPPPVYLIDDAIARLHAPWLEQIQQGCAQAGHQTLVLPGGEQSKSLAGLERIYDWLAEQSVSRDRTVVAVGGGAVLDVAGLAAATWRRGLDFVSFPTTLLAMVDAAIGGKTAINAAGLKNPVGAFHPACAILADVGFLATLPRRTWREGMAELIKTAAIGDAQLFEEIHRERAVLREVLAEGDSDVMIPGVLGRLPWARWIGHAARVKAGVVTRDFREKNERRNLNLGHTLGHALEAWSQDHGPALSHGEAVAVGMAVIFRVAAERGACSLPAAVKMIEILEACGLPTTWAAPPAEELRRLLGGDKKQTARAGLHWVVPHRIGRMNPSARVELDELLKWLEPPTG